MQLYKDYFYYCASPENDIDTGINIDTVYDCMDNGKYWRLYDISFNNIINAFITLFEMFSGKSWCSMITYLPDSYAEDYAPRHAVSNYNLWFPVIYMLLVFLFIRSLLTGAISNTFYFHNESLQGLRNLDNAQRRWVSLTKIIFKANPQKYYDPTCRFYKLYLFLNNKTFEYFILFTIISNGIVLCLKMHRQSSQLCSFFFLSPSQL